MNKNIIWFIIVGTIIGHNAYAMDAQRDEMETLGIHDYAVGATVELNENTEMIRIFDYDYYGYAVAGLGDLDGDGVVDIAVGSPGDYEDGEGDVHIHFLNPDGSIHKKQSIEHVTNNGPGPDARGSVYYGENITNMGDLDGDGVVDIAVSRRGRLSPYLTSAFYVHFLNDDGTLKATTTIATESSNPIRSMTNMGDIDGDGVNDLAVSRIDTMSSRNAWITIYYMNTDGSVKGSTRIDDPIDSDWWYTSIAGIGDLDGDGNGDIAIGVENEEQIYIYLLNADGSVKSSTARIDGSTENGPYLSGVDNYGSTVANIGDIDGDGVTDIAVGATGIVFVHYLNTDGSVKLTEKINSTTPNSFSIDQSVLENYLYGTAIANIGDLDGNGDDDMIVGAYNAYQNRSGAAYLHLRGDVKPILTEKIPIDSPTEDNTPEYTFTSTKAGVITYAGGCASLQTQAAIGDNTVIFNELSNGTYANCTIVVTDAQNKSSLPLVVSSFTVNAVDQNEEIDDSDDGDGSIASKIKDVVVRFKSRNNDLDARKTMYIKDDEFTFKGNNPEVAGGTVRLYVKQSLKGKDIIDENGKWSVKYKNANDGRKECEIILYDKRDNIVDKKKYKIRVDTDDPVITIPEYLTKRPQSILWWDVKDDSKLDKTYIYWDGKKQKIKVSESLKEVRQEFLIPATASRGIHNVRIKAYDRAGNKMIKDIIVNVR